MEELFKDIRYYIDLRVKKMKLSAVGHLSTIFGKALAFFVFIVMGSIMLLFFAVALTILIAHWLESYFWAFVIMGGVFLILTLIFYLWRDTIFRGTMIGTLSKIFFEDLVIEHDDEEEDDE